MPYLYAAFLAASETGAPVQRPLVFDHQDDLLVRDLDDEYLFGRDLLVAPVLQAGQTSRQVYLPEGDWYDWHSGARFNGCAFLMVPTPMEHIPVFARGGAVIPMWPEAPDSTDGYHPAVIELHLFVPTVDGEHRSLLQEDDGLTFAADRGQRYRTELTLTRTGDRLELRADVDGEGYPEFAREAFRLVVHGAQPASVRLDGEHVLAGDEGFLLTNAGHGMVVEIDV
jgi:alpha-glucosidase